MVGQEFLRAHAKLLLTYRNTPKSAWGYWCCNWRQMAVWYPMYVGMAFAAWIEGYDCIATAILGFWIGRALRDIQWFRAYAKQGAATEELLDWDRICKLAEGEPQIAN